MKVRQRVYVIVLNWNGWIDTIDCLASVFQSDYGDFRVVVCDNGSSDASLEHIEAWARSCQPPRQYEYVTSAQSEIKSDAPQLLLLQTGANLGFAGGNNAGIRLVMQADCEAYVLLLNNDATIAPTFLSTAMSAIMDELDGRISILGFPAFDGAGHLEQYCSVDRFGRGPTAVRERPPTAGTVAMCESVSGYAMLISPKAPVRTLPEEYFLYLEDVDLCAQVRHRGGVVAVQPDNEVRHKRSSTLGRGSPQIIYYSRRAKLHYVRKYKTHVEYLATLARMTFSSGRGIASGFLRGDGMTAWAYGLSLFDHLRAHMGRRWVWT